MRSCQKTEVCFCVLCARRESEARLERFRAAHHKNNVKSVSSLRRLIDILLQEHSDSDVWHEPVFTEDVSSSYSHMERLKRERAKRSN